MALNSTWGVLDTLDVLVVPALILLEFCGKIEGANVTAFSFLIGGHLSFEE